MSLVGPRPEVRKYTELYTEEQLKILNVRPGITDWASIEFRNENEILGKSDHPEKTYIEQIMPIKIELNNRFIQDPSLGHYFKIIFKTIF
jgi:lipopolysaccharide/colanic/teichoic acid biosynthesis glycosyltransferase